MNKLPSITPHLFLELQLPELEDWYDELLIRGEVSFIADLWDVPVEVVVRKKLDED